MSLKLASGLLVFVLFSLYTVSGESEIKPRHRKYDDPFTQLDRQMSLALAHEHSLIPLLTRQYFWPWTQLAKAAAALDDEEILEDPQISSDPKKFEVNINVRSFSPDEVKVKVRDRYVIVEGKHTEKNEKENKRYVANHFVQRYALPPGTKEEEITSVLKENGILTISAPRHELPPTPPEREVPIQLMKSAIDEEIIYKQSSEDSSTDKIIDGDQTTIISSTSAEPIELVEATTHSGKIRKKELKSSEKDSKKNEVTKPIENNVLDYATVETEE